MEFLINPNVAYFLLIVGFMAAILALFSPGTGILEVIALMTLALAAYGIVNLPINAWAVFIMVLGVIPLTMALRGTRYRRSLLLTLTSLAFLVGALLLFRGTGWLPAVNLFLVLMLSSLVLGLTWLIAERTLEAASTRPVFDLDRLVGMTGQASSDIRREGTVYVNGEEWTAQSHSFIPAGSRVRVLRRHGLTLEVEPEQQ